METKKRLIYLDMLRCLAILCVITLHAIVPYVDNTGLYGTRSWLFCILISPAVRCGVPLFFMMSGLLLLSDPRSSNVGEFYRKRLTRLLVPLLSWNLIYYLCQLYAGGRSFSAAELVRLFLNNGVSYHMWFVYTLFGIYLLVPFLRRIVTQCTPGQQVLLLCVVLFPTTIRPMLNRLLSEQIVLFDPVPNGYLGFFLLGYLLGTVELRRAQRFALYAAGVAGYVLAVLGNLRTASPEAIPLPYNGGWMYNHYLCAAAVFVLFRTICARCRVPERLEAIITRLSLLTFGVYWVHVLFLDKTFQWMANRFTPLPTVFLAVFTTTLLSFACAWFFSRIKLLKRLLM